MDAKTVSKLIRKVPDYPKPGVMFRDITPLLADADAFADVVEAMSTRIEAHNARALVALEARGFLFGAAIASRLQMPLHIARKPGKLPRQTVRHSYALEYGDDGLELHADAFPADTRCAIVDDVLATGGTAAPMIWFRRPRLKFFGGASGGDSTAGGELWFAATPGSASSAPSASSRRRGDVC